MDYKFVDILGAKRFLRTNDIPVKRIRNAVKILEALIDYAPMSFIGASMISKKQRELFQKTKNGIPLDFLELDLEEAYGAINLIDSIPLKKGSSDYSPFRITREEIIPHVFDFPALKEIAFFLNNYQKNKTAGETSTSKPEKPSIYIDKDIGIYRKNDEINAYKIGGKRKLYIELLKDTPVVSAETLATLSNQTIEVVRNGINAINRMCKEKLSLPEHKLIVYKLKRGYELNRNYYKFPRT